MKIKEITTGQGRLKVTLAAFHLGNDIIVSIYNENAHLGAVAIGDFDHESKRTSISVITRRGHKDDIVANKVAYEITKATRKPSCVIAGIHIDDITEHEIEEILTQVNNLTNELIKGEIPD